MKSLLRCAPAHSSLLRCAPAHSWSTTRRPRSVVARSGLLHVTLLLVPFGWSGCTGEPPREDAAVAPPDTVTAEQAWTIGTLDGPPEEILGDVTGVTVGPRGEVYVADRLGSTVRAFDASGSFLGTVGSEGRGPGEFVWPNDLTFDPQGRLYVRDAYRLTVFGYRSGGAFADSVLYIIPLGGVASPWSARGKTDGTRYYYPNYLYRNGERLRYFYIVYDSAGATGDTIAVPALPTSRYLGRASYLISNEGGRVLDGVNLAPFEPRASWDITAEGTIYTARGDAYEVVSWTSSGDTLRVVSLPRSPRPVPESAARDSARAFDARLDSIPVPLDRVMGMSEAARTRSLPDVLPEIIGLQIGAAGNLWLRRWPASDGPSRTYFDVLSPTGRPARTVILPAAVLADPPPFVSNELVVGVLRDPETDVERVALFRLPPP
ncbi:MAG TPA: 6-bladed beta-propeller [Longimicrobiales bacterium]